MWTLQAGKKDMPTGSSTHGVEIPSVEGDIFRKPHRYNWKVETIQTVIQKSGGLGMSKIRSDVKINLRFLRRLKEEDSEG